MAGVQLSNFLPSAIELQSTSSAVLQECADHISQRLQQARQSLLQQLHHHLLNPDDDPDGFKAALQALCETAQLSPGSPEASLTEFAWHYKQVVEQIAAAEAQQSRVKVAAEVEGQLAEFDSHLASGEYLDAAYVVVALRRALTDSEDEGRDGSALTPQLRSSCTACEPKLLVALQQHLQKAILLDPASRTLTVAASGHGCGLADVWAAFRVLDSLTSQLEALADRLLREVIGPLMTSSSCRVEVSAGPPAALQWDYQPTLLPSGGSPGVHIESALQKVLTFFAEHLFETNDEVIPSFGELFWGRLVSTYRTSRVQPLMQDTQCGLDGADRVAEAAAQLEEFASCLGFVAEEGALTSVVGDCMRAVQHTRQQPLLLAARQLLLEPSQQLQTVGKALQADQELIQRCCQGELQDWEVADAPCGWDASASVLPTGCYQVSSTALQLLQLMERAVSQAAASTSIMSAQAMCSATQHIARLAQTLPLLGTRGRQVLAIPQMSLLYYNDLQHLASGLLLATMQHAPALRAALGDSSPVVLLATAAQLRESARGILAQQVASQQLHLSELVNQMDSFRLGGSGSANSAQRKALTQVLYSLSRFGRVLLEVLPPAPIVDTCCQVLGHLSSSICGLVINRREIGADESHELAAMLQSLSDDVLQQLLSGTKQQAMLQESSGLSMEQMQKVIINSCQPLQKLRLLAKVLDSKLATITDMWQQAALQKAGFRKAEVVALIEALFEKTDFRDDCLRHVYSVD